VTFSQPMVDLTAIGEQPAPPITISPEIPGKWRWIGATMADFEPGPLPRVRAATDYTVTIAAGARSALGGTLAAAKSFHFSTTAPALTRTFPDTDSASHTPALFMSFDQAIDPAAVLAHTRVHGSSDLGLLRAADA